MIDDSCTFRFSNVFALVTFSSGEVIDMTTSTGALIDLTSDVAAEIISLDDESIDSGPSNSFPEDVLVHFDATQVFADEESLCGEHQLELLAFEYDERVDMSNWEADAAAGENKRKADSLVADLEVAPGSKRCRTAKSHAETKRSSADDHLTRIGQATTRFLKRK